MTAPLRTTLSDTQKYDCLNRILTELLPVLRGRSHGRRDPSDALKYISSHAATEKQKFLAGELLCVRHAAAHHEPIDVAGILWAYETARMFLQAANEPARARRMLRSQRTVFRHHSVGRPHDQPSTNEAEPNNEDAIRSALKRVLSSSLSGLLTGLIPDNGVNWPADADSYGCSGQPNELAELLVIFTAIWPDEKSKKWPPFPSKGAVHTVRACCKELMNSSLADVSKATDGGIARELSTAQRLLSAARLPAAGQVRDLQAALWRSRVNPAQRAHRRPRMAYATVGRKEAWKAITAAAKSGEGLFDIIAGAAQGTAEFMAELNDFLVAQGYLTFHVDASIDDKSFVASLASQLRNSPVLLDPYRSDVAKRLENTGSAGIDALMAVVAEINCLANDQPVAFLLDTPGAELVRSLKKQLRYLPTALIVYAHPRAPELDIAAMKAEQFVFRPPDDDEVKPFVRALLGRRAAALANQDVVAALIDIGRANPDLVVIASLTNIVQARPHFRLDPDDIPGTIRRFVDDEARHMAQQSDSMPSVFDCLATMRRVREPELFAEVLNAGTPWLDCAAANELFTWLTKFTFVHTSEDGAIAVQDCFLPSQGTCEPGEVTHIHAAAARYFGERVEAMMKISPTSAWNEWDRVEDPALRRDILDWLFHLEYLGPLPDWVQLLLVRLVLDAVWWYESPTEHGDLTDTILTRCRELGPFAWLEPLNTAYRCFIPRLEAVKPHHGAKWATVLDALSALRQQLPRDGGHIGDQFRAETIIDLLTAIATWRGQTDDPATSTGAASDLFHTVSASLAGPGVGEVGRWLALWADFYDAQLCGEVKPPADIHRLKQLEIEAKELGERELRVELALLHAERAWGLKEFARALDCYGRAVLHAYVYQVIHEKDEEKAPSPYTRSLYESVLRKTWARLDELRNGKRAVAEAAIDRYLLLFAPFWSDTFPRGDSPLGRRDRIFPPLPVDSDFGSTQTSYASKVLATYGRLATALDQGVDEPIYCPNPVVLRQADECDVNRIFKLGRRTFAAANVRPPYRKWERPVIEGVLTHGGGTCCVAVANDDLVGFALTSLDAVRPWGRLDCLTTDAMFQCRGVPYRLVEAVRREMRRVGKTVLMTDVFRNLELASDMGFETSGLYRSTVNGAEL
jgi:ribosomal protein S18 acetylase RimI-like enzyme